MGDWEQATATLVKGGVRWTAESLGLPPDANPAYLRREAEAAAAEAAAKSKLLRMQAAPELAAQLSTTYRQRIARAKLHTPAVSQRQRSHICELGHAAYLALCVRRTSPHKDALLEIQRASPMPRISRPQFESVVAQIASSCKTPSADTIVRALFDAIDKDADGFVSYVAIAEGLEELSEDFRSLRREERRLEHRREEAAEIHAASVASLLVQHQPRQAR